MSAAREQILAGIRRGLGRGTPDESTAATLETRLARHPPNLVPARAAGLDRRGLADLFASLAADVSASVARVPSLDEVPAAVGDYLAAQNLAAEIAAAPDPLIDAVPWATRPLLRLRRGAARASDAVGLSAAFAGIAETATLMLTSGPGSPSTLNFLPDTHIVVLPASRLVGPMEEAWAALRRSHLDGDMPRTVNFITGPSRTGDIEQKIEMGAHGPRRLHIIIVEDEQIG